MRFCGTLPLREVFNIEHVGAFDIQIGTKPMRKGVSWAREKAEHMRRVRAAIGLALRDYYTVRQPLSARLADLVKKIEQAGQNPSAPAEDKRKAEC
jgi:hypothetical protein